MTKWVKLLGLGLAGAWVVGGVSPGWGDSIVISSETAKYAIGDQLKDDADLELGPQESVRIMDPKSGDTRVLNGPYVGRLSAYSPACTGVLTCDAGRKQLSIGATRALNGAPQK